MGSKNVSFVDKFLSKIKTESRPVPILFDLNQNSDPVKIGSNNIGTGRDSVFIFDKNLSTKETF
ncbi:MAG: hypothetical protein RID18_04950, partial [Cytophagales bacterium]